MKLIEQTSNQLILRDSTIGVWILRLICTPFLILGMLGLLLVITEQTFPSFFIIFCLTFGILGVLFPSHQTICLDKNQNQLKIKTKTLLGTKKLKYSLENLKIRVEKTAVRVRTYSSLLTAHKEPIYIVVLEIPSAVKTIKISSNYSLVKNQAVEIANVIQTFLNAAPGVPLQTQIPDHLTTSSSRFKLRSKFWKYRLLWFIPLILSYIFWSNIDWKRFPSTQRQPIACSHQATPSPYCDFTIVRIIDGHPSVTAIALSADGKTLISGGKDKAIKVWDLQTGKLKKTLLSNSGEIYTVAIAPDGQTIVSGSGDRRVRIWDLSSNQQPRTLPAHNLTVKRVEISTDGKTIISQSDNELKAWDLVTGQLKASLTLPYFQLLDIDPQGQTALLRLSNGQHVRWNAATNEQTVLPTLPRLLNLASISLDGQMLVAIADSPIRWGRQRVRHLKIWDFPTITLQAEGKRVPKIVEMVLSRTHIIASTETGIQVWNLQTAQLEATLDQEKMKHLVVSPDGKLLAGMINDPNSQEAYIQVLQRS